MLQKDTASLPFPPNARRQLSRLHVGLGGGVVVEEAVKHAQAEVIRLA